MAQAVRGALGIVALMGAAAPLIAQGGGFALPDQTASGMGRAYAGSAAMASDAGSQFYNPASLAAVSGTQVSLGALSLQPSVRFYNAGSTDAGGGPVSGGDGGEAAPNAVVPALFYTTDLSPTLKAGLSLVTPFGLQTRYEADWVGRYHALTTEVKSVALRPAVAYRVSSTTALGAALSLQRTEAQLSRAIDWGTFCQGTLGGMCPAVGVSGPQAADGTVAIQGADWAAGYAWGLRHALPGGAVVGLAYQSRIRHELAGEARFTNTPAVFQQGGQQFTDTGARARLILPESATLALSHPLSDRLLLLADLTHTRWSRIQALTVHFENATPSDTADFRFRDTQRAALGIEYRYSGAVALRAGVAYDESPVRDATRTPLVPDADRRWAAVGATVQAGRHGSWDLGVSRMRQEAVPLSRSNPMAGTLQSTVHAKATTVGLQYNHAF